MARCTNCGEKLPAPLPLSCPACEFTIVPLSQAETTETEPSKMGRAWRQPTDSLMPSSSRDVARREPSDLGHHLVDESLHAPSLIRRRNRVSAREPFHQPRRLQGRIIATDRNETEPPDFDFCRALNRVIWLVLIILAPFLLAAALFLRVGPLTGFLAAAAFLFVLRYLTPTNMLALLHLSFLLHPFDRNREPGVPVRFFRVRDQETSDEYVVRMKGRTVGGNLATDDLATFEGSWRNQVLHARRALNHRTRSVTIIRESLSWLSLSLSLVVIAALILLLKEPVGWLLRETAELIAK